MQELQRLKSEVEANLEAMKGVKAEVDKSQTAITITGYDKEVVGNFAAVVRSKRPPEVYKGKGIRYADEYVRRKEAKKK